MTSGHASHVNRRCKVAWKESIVDDDESYFGERRRTKAVTDENRSTQIIRINNRYFVSICVPEWLDLVLWFQFD